MVYGCIGVVIAALLLTHAGFAAGRMVDGSFHGPQTVTYGTAPECGPESEVSVAVQGGQISYDFGAFPLKLKLAENGTFAGRARKGNRGGGQVMRARGRISDTALQANFIVNGLYGHVCSYHWSLKKENP